MQPLTLGAMATEKIMTVMYVFHTQNRTKKDQNHSSHPA